MHSRFDTGTCRMKSILSRLTLSCRDATRLASESMDRSLPWSTRFSLQLHYWICDACAQYRRQLRQVRRALRQMGAGKSQDNHDRPSPASKARLVEALRAKTDERRSSL